MQKEENIKSCTICKVEKGLDCFSKLSRSPDGLDWHCRDCKKLVNAKVQKYTAKLYMQNESKKCTKCSTIFFSGEVNSNFDKELTSEDGLRAACKKCRSIYFKEHNKLPEVRDRIAKYRSKKYLTDPDFAFNRIRRSAVNRMINTLDFEKEYKTNKYIGCNAEELYHYLRNEYLNRTGSYLDTNVNYELDHLRPLKDFKNASIEEKLKGSLFYNLRYLTKQQNRSKGCYYSPEDRALYESRRAEYELQILTGNLDIHKISLIGVETYELSPLNGNLKPQTCML